MKPRPNMHLLKRVVCHARAHAIAYTALAISLSSLAGVSYAALELPAGSVGASQIRNHAISPVKFSAVAIGGSVRHWARLDAGARLVASSSRAHVQRGGNIVTINWFDRFSSRCVPLATVSGVGDTAIGSVEAVVEPHGSAPTSVAVTGSNATRQPAAQPFYVAVIC
jgi:hypothetical protein